jgi:hypothetical protein
MRKLCVALLLLQLASVSTIAREAQESCTPCVGLAGHDAQGVPALVILTREESRAFEPADPRSAAVIIHYAIDPARDPLLEIERETKEILDWAAQRGPFDALGVSLMSEDPDLVSYAVRRLAVSAQGLGVASSIIIDASGNRDRLRLAALFERGTQAYFDALVVNGPDTAEAFLWMAERDPSKQLFAVVEPVSANLLYDLSSAISSGATRAYARVTPSASVIQALAQFNAALKGDWAFDATSDVLTLDATGSRIDMPVIAFVRGEDLKTLLVPGGDTAAPSILSVPADRLARPRLIGSRGEREITDSGLRAGRLLIGMSAASDPFAVVVDHIEPPELNVTRETIDIASERGITVEEIIRNHQAYEAFQASIEPRYIARNTTKLRFDIGGGAEGLEATIAGDYFSDRGQRADWVWEDFLINGVRWRYGRIPELPLIQPEKVTQLPLDIHLTNDYRYTFVRTTDLGGYRVHEVRFEPPPAAPPELPLYRGTVWIDARTFARIRISMVQLNLSGEVLSNEERVDFAAFDRKTRRAMDAPAVAAADARSMIWLPRTVNAQQIISAAGRSTVIQRETTFERFRLDPPEFDALLASVSASDARMVRETEAGMRYLEKRGNERVVKEGFDTARLFMVGGVHHDAGLEFPVVPLGGIDYFNFDLFGRGIQTNVFFAGVVLAVNATHPSVGGTRINLGADFFGIAIPFENTMYRDGRQRPEESVRTRPLGLFFRAGHPIWQFAKVDVSLGASHQTYRRADDTAADFRVPSNTFVITPGVELSYARRGYGFSVFYDYNRRTQWEPWGNPAEFDSDQQSFSRFGASLGKSFHLPNFQRIGVNLNYLDGIDLDRFSKYELGFFGSKRVHGVRSGSVRGERALIGHFSYGLVFSQQFRIEAFYDHAMLDDASAGFRREPFQGVGIAGQTIGPWGTLMRLDIGKMVGRNAQDGFVANVVFLKLF